MTHLLASPEALAAAVGNVDGIGATIRAANAAAAGPTAGLLAAAGDEVSAAITALFNEYGLEYQAVTGQATAFHSDFTRALSNAATSYAQAEAINGAALSAGVSSTLATAAVPVQSLLGGPGALLTGFGGLTGPGSLLTGITGFGGTGALPAAHLTDPITGLIMGGTGNPWPGEQYVEDVNTAFIQTLFPGATPLGLTTPEEFWPVTPQLGTLTFNQSVAEGVTLLNEAITSELTAGNDVVSFGFSQSSTVITNYIRDLMAAGSPNIDDLAFILAGAPNNPNGGLFARFPGLYLPFLDVSFDGALEATNPYETTIYTAQYDGIAHAPQYPLNVVSDLNALMGFFYVHSDYPDFSDAVRLPTSPGYTGNTEYYMFLTQDLPLLQPLRDFPVLGPVAADVIQPPLRVIVDLGYSDYGYADVPSPAGLFHIPNPLSVGYYLGTGALQGPYGAAVGIGVEAGLLGPEAYPTTYPWVPMVNPSLNVDLGPALNQPQTTLLSLLSGGLGDLFGGVPPILN
ncbi:PE family protein [Mycobacterium sp.]|uniref:PE family protein n=1 Tax=Mycobacterium sp. TaxID=1785 RepID=UPI003A88C9C7